ncbi:MAG: hypothetical protein KAS94_03795 [Desulfobulbaceae bacterium]|nr:hypothetical protein [Desulfobulbaceae bacterium]
MAVESEQKTKPIPSYTKVGWVVAWIVMIVLIAMISRNCVLSVKYGRQTEMGLVNSTYQAGIADGKLDKEFSLPADVRGNPVLRKAYTKGYREGISNRWLLEQ